MAYESATVAITSINTLLRVRYFDNKFPLDARFALLLFRVYLSRTWKVHNNDKRNLEYQTVYIYIYKVYI